MYMRVIVMEQGAIKLASCNVKRCMCWKYVIRSRHIQVNETFFRYGAGIIEKTTTDILEECAHVIMYMFWNAGPKPTSPIFIQHLARYNDTL